MALCAVKLGVTSVPTVTKMCRSIEYLLLSTKLEVSVNGSSVNDEETAPRRLSKVFMVLPTAAAINHNQPPWHEINQLHRIITST